MLSFVYFGMPHGDIVFHRVALTHTTRVLKIFSMLIVSGAIGSWSGWSQPAAAQAADPLGLSRPWPNPNVLPTDPRNPSILLLPELVIAPDPPVTLWPLSTPVQSDPAHPLRLGLKFYPKMSRRKHEEGRCIVGVTVTAAGLITHESLQQSSGFGRLDRACLAAVRGGRMHPATLDGHAIESTVSLPIIWRLSSH